MKQIALVVLASLLCVSSCANSTKTVEAPDTPDLKLSSSDFYYPDYPTTFSDKATAGDIAKYLRDSRGAYDESTSTIRHLCQVLSEVGIISRDRCPQKERLSDESESLPR